MEKSLSSGVSTKAPHNKRAHSGADIPAHRDWLLGLILILFVILAYTPVRKAGFVWHDELILTANPCIVGPLGWNLAADGVYITLS
jgi:hypothetical protein